MRTSFTFRTDAQLAATIRNIAAANSKPVSVLIRDAIRAGLMRVDANATVRTRADIPERSIQ